MGKTWGCKFSLANDLAVPSPIGQRGHVNHLNQPNANSTNLMTQFDALTCRGAFAFSPPSPAGSRHPPT